MRMRDARCERENDGSSTVSYFYTDLSIYLCNVSIYMRMRMRMRMRIVMRAKEKEKSKSKLEFD